MGTSDSGQEMRILSDEKSSHLIPRFETFLFHFPMTHTSFFWHFVVCVWYGLGVGVGLEEELCFEPQKVPYTKAIEKLQEMQKRNKG